MNPWLFDEWALLQPLWLAAAVLLLLASLPWHRDSHTSHWRRVLSPSMASYLGIDTAAGRIGINPALLIAAMIAICLSQPARMLGDELAWRHSSGWIIVADVSRSMTLSDTLPSRVGAMRQALVELSAHAATRPIALIVFAGDAFLIAPPAFDRTLFVEQVAQLEYGIIPMDGSNLTRALSLATAVIGDSGLLRARIFVLGDSGGAGDSSADAAGFLSDAGHRVDLLVFGSGSGPAALPLESTGPISATQGQSWSQNSGPLDSTAVESTAARAVAEAGNGIALYADALGRIDFQALRLQGQSDDTVQTQLSSLIWKSQSHWILLLLLPLILQRLMQEFRPR